MAYSTLNPPMLLVSAGIDGAANIWQYSSADPIATVEGAAYISNGGSLNMRVGDIVFVRDTNLGHVYFCWVTAVAAAQNNNALLPGFNAPGAATVSGGLLG